MFPQAQALSGQAQSHGSFDARHMAVKKPNPPCKALKMLLHPNKAAVHAAKHIYDHMPATTEHLLPSLPTPAAANCTSAAQQCHLPTATLPRLHHSCTSALQVCCSQGRQYSTAILCRRCRKSVQRNCRQHCLLNCWPAPVLVYVCSATCSCFV